MVRLAVVGVAALRLQGAGLLVALDSVAELPLTVTVEPTNCSAEVASLVCCIEMSVCRLVFMLICCSTEANQKGIEIAGELLRWVGTSGLCGGRTGGIGVGRC